MAPDLQAKITGKKSGPAILMRLRHYGIILIFLGLAVHLLLPQIAPLEHSLQVLRNLTLWVVGVAAVAQAASYVGSGYLLKATLGLAQGSLSIMKGTVITLASASIGLVAGGIIGGGAATYRWLRKEGVNADAAGLAGTLPPLFNNLLLLLAAVFGLIHLLLVHQLSQFQLAGFSIALALLIVVLGIAAWGMRNRQALVLHYQRIGRRWAQIWNHNYDEAESFERLDGFFSAWDSLVSGGWRRIVLGSGLNVGFDMLTLYFLFLAAGHPISPGVLLTGYGLPLLLGKMAFLIPGGVGVIEGSMAGLFNGLGVPGGVTVVVVLSYRILSFWLPTLLGFPLAAALQRKSVPAQGILDLDALSESRRGHDTLG